MGCPDGSAWWVNFFVSLNQPIGAPQLESIYFLPRKPTSISSSCFAPKFRLSFPLFSRAFWSQPRISHRRINTAPPSFSTSPCPAPPRFEMSTTHRASTLLACLSRPGPSRLAKQLKPCQACAEHLRYASTSADSVEASEDAEPVAAPTSAGEGVTARGQGYDAWLRSVGRRYKDSPTNGPNWLGGHVVSFSSSYLSFSTNLTCSSR